MTAYWCELAWLGGERAEAGVLIDVEDARITAVTGGVETPPAGAARLDGVLFVDRVTDPRTLTTWDEFDRFHRDDFERRARELVERVGS